MAVTVASDELEATFRPDRGMLGTSLRHRGEELFGPEGLPLLAPWANRLGAWRYEVDGLVVELEGLDLHTDPNGLPIHGTMMDRPGWEIVDRGPGALTTRFDFAAHDDLLASFPFPHRLTIDVTVEGSTLRLATTLEATGDRVVPVSFGYHPYFRLRRTARLRLPPRRHLRLRTSRWATARSTTSTRWAAAVPRWASPATGGASRSASTRATRTPRSSPPPAATSCASNR